MNDGTNNKLINKLMNRGQMAKWINKKQTKNGGMLYAWRDRQMNGWLGYMTEQTIEQANKLMEDRCLIDKLMNELINGFMDGWTND